ncbi:MAG: diaminopimelate epimerase [Candidatus Omnitrophica bacterium]|nr:diaminopimelate epimerase [Candidatus Omnitrophota bacterium]
MNRKNTIPIVKMSGSGNLFVLVDNRAGLLRANLSSCARKVCRDERVDGLLVVEAGAGNENGAFQMHFFNPDGSEPGMCGNGARCVAYFAVSELKLPARGLVFNVVNSRGSVQADVRLKGHEVSISRLPEPTGYQAHVLEPLAVGLPKGVEISFMDSGVPHTVVWGLKPEAVEVERIGRRIREHNAFKPGGTNVNFAAVRNRRTLFMRTYERGVERETGACGTGAIATAVIAALEGRVESFGPGQNFQLTAETRLGEELQVKFELDRAGRTARQVSLTGRVQVLERKEIGVC